MRLKELEGYLQQLDTFESPKVHLEQYATTPHIASHMLYTMANTFDELQDNIVADFGCGCGVLSIGAAMLGAYVISLDVDTEAIDIATQNVDSFEVDNVDFIQIDLMQDALSALKGGKIDTVIMNPPFGTKNNKGTLQAVLNVY